MGKIAVEICKLHVYKIDRPGCINILNPFYKRTWQWQAEATGTGGIYIVAFSTPFRSFGDDVPSSHGEMVEKRNEIVSKLLHDGWRPMNDNFYHQSFTREIEID